MVWTMPLTLISMHLQVLSHSHCGGIPRGQSGCLQEASPTALNGFQSEMEKEPVQSDLRHLCINYRMDNIVLINLLKYSTKN